MGCGSSTESSNSDTITNHKPEPRNNTTTSSKQTAEVTELANTAEAEPSSKQTAEVTNTAISEPESSGKSDDEAFSHSLQLALAKHNEYRALHRTPPMSLDRQLCRMAQDYAENLSRIGKMEHAKKEDAMVDGENVGENLYWSQGYTGNHGVMATEGWYNEIKDYDWSSHGFSMGTGHFTQVVWKKSAKLGIGIAENGKGEIMVVARYYPAGNMMGDFEPNVPRLL